MRSTLPPTRSASAGELPRYGTCTISMPAMRLKSSPERWIVVPTPADEKLSLPVGFGVGDELRYRRHRQALAHAQHVWRACHLRKRHDVLLGIVRQSRIHEFVGRETWRHRSEE